MSKGSSDRRINYNLRPSKSIERKMILEVLKEVCTPLSASEYRYVGFGSSFFTDFKLLHKGLNINDMVSIEKSNPRRVEFNRPYSCIKLVKGFSKDELPKLKWDKKSIVWLDYETALKPYMFDDIKTCSHNLKAGSFFIITLRRDFDQDNKEAFEEEFSDFTPIGLKNEDLEPEKSAGTIQRMFKNCIEDTLSEAYAAYADLSKKIFFKQLFNFTYKDDAKMYTFGGMLINGDEEDIFSRYNFNNLEFVKSDDIAYDISFPIITNKELHILNSLLPDRVRDSFIENDTISFIPREHRESYYNTYKFYPAYIEISDL